MLNLALFQKDLLIHKKIGLDSMCFLYQFADHPDFAPITNTLFDLVDNKKIMAVTSTVTIVETFIQAERANNQMLIFEYEKFFRGIPNLTIIPVDWHLARLAAKVRATYSSIKTPDALQISAAILDGCQVFLTNDSKLKNIKEIEVLLLTDYL